MADPGHIQAFQQLLFHIRSDDNDARFVAEARFWEFVRSNPSAAIYLLFHCVSNATEWNIQIFSLILLHRLYKLANEAIFSSITDEVHSFVCESLLTLISNPAFHATHSQLLSFSAAGIAQFYLRRGFPAFLPHLFTLASTCDTVLTPAAFDCLSYCIGFFGDDELPLDKPLLLALFDSVIVPGPPIPIVAAGLRLLFQTFAHNYIVDAALPFAPRILTLYSDLLSSLVIEPYIFFFDLYIFIFWSHRFFASCIDATLSLLLRVIGEQSLSERSRRTAIDSLCVLALHYSVASHTPQICATFITGMCEVVVDASPEFEDESSFCATCGVAFGQLVSATTDRRSMAAHTLSLVHDLLHSPHVRWECAYASLKALRRLMPHCYDIVSDCIDDIVTCLSSHFTHGHWFVRHEAFLALARYLQQPDLAVRYHCPVIDAVMCVLDRGDAEVVVSAALVALSVVLRNLPPDVGAPLAVPVASAVLRVFACGAAPVQEQSVRVLSSLLFSFRTPALCPPLLELLRSLHSSAVADPALLCRAVEAVAIVADLAPPSFEGDLPFFLDAWMRWDWAALPQRACEQLIAALPPLIDRFPIVVQRYADHLVLKMSVLIAFEPDCITYEPYSQEIAFPHDRLVFASGGGTYVEYRVGDLLRLQFTLELLAQVVRLAGPARASLFQPFTKRLRGCLRWHFFPRVQIAALRCLADLAAESGDADALARIVVAIVRRLEEHPPIAPIAQREFVAVLRPLIRAGIGGGWFDAPAFLRAVPELLARVWAPREEAAVEPQPPPASVEEQLARAVTDIVDCCPEAIGDVHVPDGPRSCASPYFMLVCAKFVEVTQTTAAEWENALLLAVSNAIGDDDSDIVRVGCEAFMCIVGRIVLDSEFINEIVYCAGMALRKHERVRATVDAVVVVLAALMLACPEQGAKGENVMMCLNALPVETCVVGRKVVWQWLAAVMQGPVVWDMRREAVERFVEILAAVAGTEVIDRESEEALRVCLAEIVQAQLWGETVMALDEGVQRKLVALLKGIVDVE
jgi:hypothetical protein